jgi:hypothetical protein
MNDIEGKAAQEAASECGQRASFNREANPLAETFVRISKVPFRNEAARGTQQSERIVQLTFHFAVCSPRPWYRSGICFQSAGKLRRILRPFVLWIHCGAAVDEVPFVAPVIQ